MSNPDAETQQEEKSTPVVLRLPEFPIVGNAPWYLMLLVLMAAISWEVVSLVVEVTFA